MTSADSAPASRPERDILTITPGELRDTIRLTIDRELVDELDRRRGSISRSEYTEMVLTAALEREHPHLPENWTPERAADQRFARLIRYRQTGR
jgi:hypothetical protein